MLHEYRVSKSQNEALNFSFHFLSLRLKWSIMKKVHNYKPWNFYCALCVAENRHILFANSADTTNSRDEFVSKCRHQNNYTSTNFKHDINIDLLAHTSNKETENLIGIDTCPRIKRGEQIRRKSKHKSDENMNSAQILGTTDFHIKLKRVNLKQLCTWPRSWGLVTLCPGT